MSSAGPEKKRPRVSLQAKLTAIILLAVIIPLSFTAIFLAGRLRRMITAETIRKEQVQTAEAAPALSELLSEITGRAKKIRAGELTSEAAVFDPVISVRQYVDLPAEDPFFARPENSRFSPLSQVKGTYWYGVLSATRRNDFFCPPRYLGIREREQNADCSYVSTTRVNDTELGSLVTYLVLYFSSDRLRDILAEHLTHSDSVSYIADDNDETVTSTDSARAGIYYMNYDTIRTSLMSSNGFLERKVLGETVYVSYFYLAAADWYLVSVTPDAPLARQSRSLLFSFIVLYLLAAGAAILVSSLLARSIAKRIGTVSRQMSAVQAGPPVPLEMPAADDEVGDLVDSYNYMADKINQLMEEQQEAAEELRVAEFRSLQAQINPHFLFNTMEMINQLASTGRTEKTNEAITALSKFYRLTLSRQETDCTVGDEVEHVSIYVKIQNMRFDDGIDFVVDMPDELLEFRIPRLTLQPIVENAILHGILEKPERSGTIVLTGWQEEGDVVLLLSDDGVGMSEERQSQLLTGTLKSGKGAQIAVYNTHRRLQVAYGERYGLTFRSAPGRGTEVTVRIPAKTKEEAETL